MSELSEALAAGVARRNAYLKGWAAAGRGTDLDAAETRYLRRNGHEHVDDWARGWEDRANGRPRRP